jgi:hypothetical protein
MFIIETIEQFDTHLSEWTTDEIIYIPWFVHLDAINPTKNAISLLLIYTKLDMYVLVFNHVDAQSLPVECLARLPWLSTQWVMHKKQLLHIVPQARLTHDLQAMVYLQGRTIDMNECHSTPLRSFLRRLKSIDGGGSVVPLMLVVGYGNMVKQKAQELDGTLPSLSFMSQTVIPTLCFLERSGIAVDEIELKTQFGKTLMVQDGRVFSDFNPYTTTGRITNKYLNNLKKSDGSRRIFISRFKKGQLLSFDFESFHVRLIAEMIGYELPKGSVHEYFGCQYFNATELTPEQYEESKRRTFSLLYKDDPDTPNIPYFRQVQEYIHFLWTKLEQDGYISSITGRRIYKSQIESPSPAKVFNYLLQLREMEVVAPVLQKLEELFKGKESVITLYTYDAIVVDFSLNDGAELIYTIVDELEHGGKFPVRIYAGQNYHDLANITNFVKNTTPVLI